MNCGLKYLKPEDIYFLHLWQQKAEKKITEKEFWERLKGKKTYIKLYFSKINA